MRGCLPAGGPDRPDDHCHRGVGSDEVSRLIESRSALCDRVAQSIAPMVRLGGTRTGSAKLDALCAATARRRKGNTIAAGGGERALAEELRRRRPVLARSTRLSISRGPTASGRPSDMPVPRQQNVTVDACRYSDKRGLVQVEAGGLSPLFAVQRGSHPLPDHASVRLDAAGVRVVRTR